MSPFSTVRSDLELYVEAQQAAIGDEPSTATAPLAHSLVLTRQMIAALDSADTASAFHITFCQTINLLSLSVASSPWGEIESPAGESEAMDVNVLGFAGLIGGRTRMTKFLPWLSFTYSKYCDCLWSSTWRTIPTIGDISQVFFY